MTLYGRMLPNGNIERLFHQQLFQTNVEYQSYTYDNYGQTCRNLFIFHSKSIHSAFST